MDLLSTAFGWALTVCAVLQSSINLCQVICPIVCGKPVQGILERLLLCSDNLDSPVHQRLAEEGLGSQHAAVTG